MASRFDLAAWADFCSREVAARAGETDRCRAVAAEVWSGIRAHGYLQLFHAPADHDLYGAMFLLAKACAATYWKATISTALCGRMLRELAPGPIGERWIARLVTGESLGCFAATERGSGSDPASYRATLAQREGGWVLTGEKTRVANAPDADVAAVLCNALDRAGRPLGLALAIVDLRGDGVSRTRLESMGLRGLGWGSLRFDGVPLADAEVVLDTTMPKTLTVVEWGQVIQILCALGVAEAALEAAHAFTATRASFGRPLADNEVVCARVDEAKLELDAVALLARDVVARKACSEIAGAPLVMAKIFASEAGVRACHTALGLCGGWGYSTELPVERLLRDAYGNVPAGLPNERLRDLLVCPVLGLDPWQRMG